MEETGREARANRLHDISACCESVRYLIALIVALHCFRRLAGPKILNCFAESSAIQARIALIINLRLSRAQCFKLREFKFIA